MRPLTPNNAALDVEFLVVEVARRREPGNEAGARESVAMAAMAASDGCNRDASWVQAAKRGVEGCKFAKAEALVVTVAKWMIPSDRHSRQRDFALVTYYCRCRIAK